jgi:hypothetical protein
VSGNSSRPDLPEGLDAAVGNGADASAAGAARRRGGPASVTIRRRDDGDGLDGAPSLDPATKSLADALRITYRLLQASMVVLIGLYVLSGFQSVKESERGIRLTMAASPPATCRRAFSSACRLRSANWSRCRPACRRWKSTSSSSPA